MGERLKFLKGFSMLTRIIAVAFSSFVTILSTSLPLILYYSELNNINVIIVMIILLLGAFLTHGLLTHITNDLADYKSGTDEHSPGALSGGSRVIQSKVFTYNQLKMMGIILSVMMITAATLFFMSGYMELGILVIIGMWGAYSYSVNPFSFAYKPFVGEWISLFPSMLFLGIAAPWIMLDTVPVWAWFNAVINAIWCMAWVMVHHIPDIEADKRARPVKNTSVVYVVDKWGKKSAQMPALFYLLMIGGILIFMMWMRPIASIISLVLILVTVYLLFRMHNDDVEAVTAVEKLMLVMASITAIVLGVLI